MRRSLKGALAGAFFFFAICAASESAEEGLEPIIVSRLPYGSAADGPVSAVITADRIKDIPANTPEDLLAYAGADLKRRGPGNVKSDLSLNGSTFQQVLVLVNGVRVKDAQTAHHDLDLFFDIEDIERIEIIPASASVKYGPDGIGGAVNFVLKKPQTGQKSSVTSSVGNHESFEEKLNLFYPAAGFKNRMTISDARSAGDRPDTDYRNDVFFHSSVLETQKGSFFLDAGYNEKEFGAYDFYTPGRGFDSKEWTNTKYVDARGIFDAGRVTFEPRLNFREHFDKFFLRKSNPDFYMNHHRTDTYQAGGVVTYSWDELTLPVAADYGEEIITSSNLGDHTRGHWDLVADPTYRWADDSSLNLTLRLDDYTTFGEEVTGSVSYKRVLDEAQDVYVTFGRTMRVPTFTELYYSDPTTVGDPDLKPEHALNFETGWGRRFSEKVRTSLSFFVRQEDDTIDYTKLTPADPRFVARNISQSIAFGPSLFGEWRASERIAWDMRYSYTEKRSDDGGLIYKYGPNYLKHFIDLGMTNVFSWGSHRVDIIMNKEPLRRAWTLVNERVSWDLSKGWEVFGEVENLLNVEYQETEGIPSSGRLFRVGVKATW